MSNAATELAAERYLRFHDLRTAPGYSDLTVWVDGAVAEPERASAETGNADIDRAIGPVRRITTNEGQRRYEVVFTNVLAFSVRMENFVIPEENEDFTTPLRRYQQSRFLEFIEAATFVRQMQSEPIQHIAVVTMDQVIDVAVTEDPEVNAKIIGPDDRGLRAGLPTEYI